MRKLVQSQPDNCWQTCVAMLLDVDPDELPDQHAMPNYGNPLRAYLYKHHDLTYAELGSEFFPAVAVKQEFHIICGETIRTPENGWHHVIVGRYGEAWWDVHPSLEALEGPVAEMLEREHPKHDLRRRARAPAVRTVLVPPTQQRQNTVDELRVIEEAVDAAQLRIHERARLRNREPEKDDLSKRELRVPSTNHRQA